MKKLLFAILACSLAFIFALSGCSCAVTQPLVFNKTYLGEGSGNYSETLEYTVGYESTYQSITNSTNTSSSDIPAFNGTYVVYFSDSNNDPGVTTDINFENDYHYIKSVLSLSFTHNGKTYNDQIVSEVYFHSKEWSYAPVYSKTTMKYTYFTVNTQDQFPQVIYQYTTLYKKSSYVLTKTHYDPDENEDINLIDITDENSLNTQKLVGFNNSGASHEYTLRRAVDNAQLMFAIRNSTLSTSLPTVSYSYDVPINIKAESKGQENCTINQLDYNGQSLSNVNMPITNVVFGIDSTNNKGSSKFMKIQKEAVGDIKNNALIVEYAEPLLSGLTNVGALVYKLNKVTIGN